MDIEKAKAIAVEFVKALSPIIERASMNTGELILSLAIANYGLTAAYIEKEDKC